MSKSALVNVVIPTKSNFAGLLELVGDLSRDAAVGSICVVVDGDNAFLQLPALPSSILIEMVDEGIGIHQMWNRGIDAVGRDQHIAFLNDDVRLDDQCLSILGESLEADPTIGLICPNYSTVEMSEDCRTTSTCRSRYDGSGGMAGFAMVLRRSLVAVWNFDENLTWWYGDDDIVLWVTRTMTFDAVISHRTRCHHHDGATVRFNTPPDFARLVEKDRQYFESKWN